MLRVTRVVVEAEVACRQWQHSSIKTNGKHDQEPKKQASRSQQSAQKLMPTSKMKPKSNSSWHLQTNLSLASLMLSSGLWSGGGVRELRCWISMPTWYISCQCCYQCCCSQVLSARQPCLDAMPSTSYSESPLDDLRLWDARPVSQKK